MQKDFAMFTDAGNAAVAAIVEDAVDRYTNPTDAWERCCTELEKLQTVEAFAEADDTAVREAVWSKISNHFSQKTVDSTA